jgi:hypothetical protein
VHRLYRYIINFVDVRPDSDRLSVYRISKTLKDFELTRIAHAVNTYSQSLVSTLLSSEYGGLKPGVYVASVGRVADRDMLRDELKYAFARYFEVLSQRSSERKHIRPFPLFYDVDELVNALVNSVTEEAVPSTSYVTANLLNNLVGRSVSIQYKCYEKGVRICIKLDVKALRELMQKDEEFSREPLFDFCREHPNLCGGEGNDGCARFFRVIKELLIRFQHSVVNDEEKLYVILFSRYRRLSNLELKSVIDFLKNDVKLPAKDMVNALRGVRVNVALPEGSALYEIKNVESEEGGDVVELKCVDKEQGKSQELRIHYNELDSYNVRINPTYKSSREFIYSHLCKYYDEHKKLTQVTPSTYFKTLEKDLKIFKRLLAEFKLSSIVLGDVTYTIGDSFIKV